MEFKSKIVLITGASRGIGFATAQRFAMEGASVALHYRSNPQLANNSLDKLPGKGHQLFQKDLNNENGPEELINAVVDTYGRIDVLVNNAGIFVAHPLPDSEFELWNQQWKSTLATNLIAPAHLAYWAGRQMIKQQSGRIINVGSRGAFRGEPEAPAYGAAKAGLHSLTQSLALKLAAYGISVCAVAPGFVETEMIRERLGELGDSIKAQSPFNRVAKPEEVAAAIVFLAREESAYHSGAILDINGASYLRT
jgi:3-oxoacyl-[acyl-carrier protein] reductase